MAVSVACASSADSVPMHSEDLDTSRNAGRHTTPTTGANRHSSFFDNPNDQSEVSADVPAVSSNNNNKSRKGKRLLWQFLLHDLLNSRSDLSWHPNQLENPGVFSFKDPNSAAKRWGFYKGNENMSYEKMSRCIRDYYTRRGNSHFGVMQPDQPTATTNSSKDKSPPRRRLHFAFNLRDKNVAAFIRQHAAGYFHRLVVMKLVG